MFMMVFIQLYNRIVAGGWGRLYIVGVQDIVKVGGRIALSKAGGGGHTGGQERRHKMKVRDEAKND